MPLGRKSETGINRICHVQLAVTSCYAVDCSVYARQIATSASIDCSARFGPVGAWRAARIQHAHIRFVTAHSAADRCSLRAAQSCLAHGEHLSLSNSSRLNSGEFLDESLN
jgi:hypothetical protein